MRSTRLIVLAIGLVLCALAAQAGWTPVKRLTWTSGASTLPAIAADAFGGLHLVWVNFSPGNAELYYKKSTNGGTTWSASQRLTWNSGDSTKPVLAVDPSGNPHVVWQDLTPGIPEIYYTRSTDGGTTWSANQRLTWNSGYSNVPSIAVDSSGNPHVVWHDNTPGNYEIYYRKSQDGGATWLAAQRLSWTTGNSYTPDLAADSSGKLHLVWGDWTPGRMELYYKKSTNGGATWSTVKRLTWNPGDSSYPKIALGSAGLVHLVWTDETPGNSETYYKKSTDGGATWSTGKRLTWNAGDTSNLALVADPSKNPHVIWIDTTPGNREVYYKKSTDGGAAWSASERLTHSSYETYELAMAADPSGNVHAVWEDGTIGDIDIYYRKGS
jgi:BNR repeat-like domain